MRRSVRNGIAVVGMAGGMWFLGHAAANAATTDGQTTGSNAVISQNAQNGPGGDDSKATNHNNGDASASASNSKSTDVSSTNTGGDATNSANINTGVQSGVILGPPGATTVTPQTKTPEPPKTTQTVNGGDVNATQNAKGGDVINSGNVAVQNSGSQTANANAVIDQNAQNAGGKKADDSKASNHNNGDATADSSNSSSTDVTTTNSGGNASNDAWINTGLIGNFYCAPFATCTINGGNVNLTQNAQGGNVVGSGNVGVNAPVPGVSPAAAPCKCEPTPPCPKAAAKPAVKTAAAVHPVVLSAAQPTGVLATTGAETSTPLTVGLIALAAGTGLTLAGRRRATATV